MTVEFVHFGPESVLNHVVFGWRFQIIYHVLVLAVISLLFYRGLIFILFLVIIGDLLFCDGLGLGHEPKHLGSCLSISYVLELPVLGLCSIHHKLLFVIRVLEVEVKL